MQADFKIFLKKIIIFTIIVSVLQFLLVMQLPERFVSHALAVIILFFFGFTTVMHRYLLKSTEGRPQKFIFNFMLLTTVKLLMYLSIILIYVLFNKDDALSFIGAFFLNYFIFTIFEIIEIMKYLKIQKP